MSLDDHFVSEDEIVKIQSDLPSVMSVEKDELDLQDKEKIRIRLEHRKTDKELELDVIYDTNDDGLFHSGYRMLLPKGNGEYVDILPVAPERMIQAAFQNVDAFLKEELGLEEVTEEEVEDE